MAADKSADRTEVLQTFGHALAALISAAMPDATPGDIAVIRRTVELGLGSIHVNVNTDPFIIVGEFRFAEAVARPPIPLFRIDTRGTAESMH